MEGRSGLWSPEFKLFALDFDTALVTLNEFERESDRNTWNFVIE
jgi:hypothetical protein